MFDLAAELPRLLPKAIAWAESEAAAASKSGATLDETGTHLAGTVGVEHPELIRVVEAAELPFPSDRELAYAARQTGLLGPGMVGLTLGYAVFILAGRSSNRLLTHEFRHVYQYEAAGSIKKYMPLYLQQIVQFGYEDAPYEVDARAHEIDIA